MILRTSLSLYLVAIAGMVLAQEGRPLGAGDAVAEAVPMPEKDGEEAPARREVQFVAADEPYEMEFFGADPRLLEQKFVAVLRFRYPNEHRAGSTEILPADVAQSWVYLDLSLARGRSLLTAGPRSSVSSHVEYFSDLAKRVPEERRPSDELLSILSAGPMHLQFTGDARRSLQRRSSISGKEPRCFEFRILAPTQERCEELAQALLTLFDDGLSRPSVSHVQQLEQAKQEELASQETKRDAAAAKLDGIVKQLNTPAEVRSEDLPSLMPQRHLLEVDLAGVRARIAAAEGILSQSEQLTASRREQVENIKITAEIELAGLAARQRTLQQIIEKGKQRADLETRQSRAEAERKKWSSLASRTENSIGLYAEFAKVVGPLPLDRPDGTVAIQPIKWQERN